MRRAPFLGLAHLAPVTIALLLLIRVLASAQDVTESALKAAYIYKFALFTEWPGDALPATAPLVMCVLGDTAVGDALQREVRNRAIGGHKITVSRPTVAAAQHGCHILYVSGLSVSDVADLVKGLRDASVLTIGDPEGFTQQGGMVQFFFEHGQLRFAVQVATAKRARLEISSKLLTIGRPK